MALSRIFNKRNFFIAFLVFLIGAIVFSAAVGVYVFNLSRAAKDKFAGKKWELPARIYARPLELYPGLTIDPEKFTRELKLMQYRETDRIDAPGSYSQRKNTFTLFSRNFQFQDSLEKSKKSRIIIKNNKITSLIDLETGDPAGLVRLDPAHIGSFYPTHNQDRLWVKFKDVPPLLIQTVLAVEDQGFYKHFGVEPKAIFRAMIVNFKQGRTVQGGSTLTQQLVKNLFLSKSQTLKRKFDEAVMALSLEWSYEKDQIFEAYINEVYMGQDGNRAIHGFGMASFFYFGRSISDLQPEETAFLAGLLKGPSYYDPRRFHERSLERRNLILKVMKEHKLISPDFADQAVKTGLGVSPDPPSGTSRFPVYMDFVKRSLLKEYNEKDLRTEGLSIFTFLDPQIQLTAEQAIVKKLDEIEKRRGFPKGELETAAIITSTGGSEILALLGSREPGTQGFNRALDARRSIGSLIKPAVYLTALQSPENYTLISPLDDSELEIKDRKNVWTPKNYDRQFHGIVPLYQSLAHSYNVATVRLGMNLGLEKVFDTIHKLGVDQKLDLYPSALLGTMSMSVLDVAQMYQTLASGGFYSPARAIQSVYKPDGTPLQRYPLTVRENIDPGSVYLLNKALQAVVLEGTARSLNGLMPQNLGIAGKTGTTNDLRDSWFAGFTGNRLAVVWVGRDDNKTCSLTGSTGALQVWGNIMSRTLNTPLKFMSPGNVKWVTVDPESGFLRDESCPGTIAIPFISGSEPKEYLPCGQYDETQQQPDKSGKQDNTAKDKKPS
ncbi:penicillin-binding protein 1B, partial [Desulfobacterales bacterium HSG17]|nr:penicillin-binding protein 1B [Desulfobacterales bacterium HSG17]